MTFDVCADASIWLHQFLKAMRDGEGNLLKDAHIVGFFRRICKLLFFRIKPVFVFDGAAPALKQSTMAARRHRHERSADNVKRTAEKILSNRLRARLLDTVAEANKAAAAAETSMAVASSSTVVASSSSSSQAEMALVPATHKEDDSDVSDDDLLESERLRLDIRVRYLF